MAVKTTIAELEAKFNSFKKWQRIALIVLAAFIVFAFVRDFIRQKQIDRRNEAINSLQAQFDTLQMKYQAQAAVTALLLKKDSLEGLSYEVVKQNNNQIRLYEKQKTDEQIKEARDAINRGDYDAVIRKFWAD